MERVAADVGAHLAVRIGLKDFASEADAGAADEALSRRGNTPVWLVLSVVEILFDSDLIKCEVQVNGDIFLEYKQVAVSSKNPLAPD